MHEIVPRIVITILPEPASMGSFVGIRDVSVGQRIPILINNPGPFVKG